MDNQQNLSPTKGRYASRWLRLLGYFIDTVILAVILTCVDQVFVASGFYITIYDSCPNDNAYYWICDFIEFGCASVLFLLLNALLIYKRGQTVGKLVCGTVVVTRDFRQASGNRYLFMRAVPYCLVGLIPFLGNGALFLDAMAIFRPEKNRLFDDWAKTRVIRRKHLRKPIEQEF